MQYLMQSIYVAVGAAIGANARYWIGFLTNASKQTFPWPTLLINILGSAMLGAFSAAALIKGWGTSSRLFFAVGVCGGFTTFSTFSYEVVATYYEKSWKMAALYALASFLMCIGGCFAGGHLARVYFQSQGHTVENSSNPFAKQR